MILNFQEQIQKVKERITNKESMLGIGLTQPYNSSNSGARKILSITQFGHALPLLYSDVPIIETGYEIRFGDRSSSIIKADSDYEVMDKICKFSKCPNHHYYLIVKNIHTNELGVIERVSYNHTTESYGYLYNNTILDNLDIGYEVPKDDILRTSLAFDDNMNRCDGRNLLTAYICSDKTMEDGIIISESASKKLASPLLKKVSIIINDNDIPLNLMGDDNIYKSFPDIGEEVKNGILCGIRREKIEESLFTQSCEKLRDILMSDDKYTVEGEVIDIDIYCNNPEHLKDKYTNGQLLYYYNERQNFVRTLVASVDELKSRGYIKLSYDLQKLYHNCKKELNEVQFMNDKLYSGTIIDIVVLERNVPKVGDKISNRYGGKGVISKIIPDNLMPRLDTGEYVEVQMNSSTCVNRLNPGQLMETSLTHIGSRIVEFLKMQAMDYEDQLEYILKFISMVSPEQAELYRMTLKNADPEDIEYFVNKIKEDGYILLSNRPITENMTLDKLNEIYKEFAAPQHTVLSPIKDSTGKIRYVTGRRPIVCGRMYIYRLKQYAEEKFSVTSLSSTNIRNENTRNKSNKNFKALHSNTPIQFGNMETGDFAHLGMEYVVSNLMIHSVSPQARRLVEKLLTDDPFEIDIRLDQNSKNRNVEIVNAYLKTMGLRLVFEKRRKVFKRPLSKRALCYEDKKDTKLVLTYVDKEAEKNFSMEEFYNIMKSSEDSYNQRGLSYKPLSYK